MPSLVESLCCEEKARYCGLHPGLRYVELVLAPAMATGIALGGSGPRPSITAYHVDRAKEALQAPRRLHLAMSDLQHVALESQ